GVSPERGRARMIAAGGERRAIGSKAGGSGGSGHGRGRYHQLVTAWIEARGKGDRRLELVTHLPTKLWKEGRMATRRQRVRKDHAANGDDQHQRDGAKSFHHLGQKQGLAIETVLPCRLEKSRIQQSLLQSRKTS